MVSLTTPGVFSMERIDLSAKCPGPVREKPEHHLSFLPKFP
jgi:hypothetical protein